MPSGEKDKEQRHSRVVQISNISPSASREQIHHMFGYLGHIDEMKVYPTESNPLYANIQSRLCYIKYEDSSAVAAAQHMTNTVFIDRALICVPVPEGRIPDEETALKIGGPSLPGQRQLPPNVINQIQLVGSSQLMVTIDPTLASLGLSDYPPLPANTDATKIEEIRRTIYVGNVSKESKLEDLLDFFNDKIGEVMYLRMAGGEDLSVRYAYIEFSNQHSVPTALQNNGIEFNGNKLRIQHSTVSIMKPRAKTEDMAKKEVEEAVKKAEAANPMIAKGVDSSDELLRRFAESSRSPSRKRSRSRLSSERYERERHRTRSRTPAHKRTSRSSRRSPSPGSSNRRRSRSGDRKRKSRSRSKDRGQQRSSRKRSRSRSSSRKRLEKERERDSKIKTEEIRKKERRGDRDRSREKKDASSSSLRGKDSKQHHRHESSSSKNTSSSSTTSKRGDKNKSTTKEEKIAGDDESFKEPEKPVGQSPLSGGKSSELDLSSPKLTSTSTPIAVETTTEKKKMNEEKFPADDDTSFVDELLEKTHVKKEKRKKEKKEKRRKRDKISSSSKRKRNNSSGDEESSEED